MNEDHYSILVDDLKIAQHVTLEYAVIFLKAIMDEYYRDPSLSVTIKRDPEDLPDLKQTGEEALREYAKACME